MLVLSNVNKSIKPIFSTYALKNIFTTAYKNRYRHVEACQIDNQYLKIHWVNKKQNLFKKPYRSFKIIFKKKSKMEMEDVPVETYNGLDDLADGDEDLQKLIQSILNNQTTAQRSPQQLLTVHWSVLLIAIIFIFGTLGKSN